MSNSKEVRYAIPEVDRVQGLGCLDLGAGLLPSRKGSENSLVCQERHPQFQDHSGPVTELEGHFSSVPSFCDPPEFDTSFVLKESNPRLG